jgi:endonuclease/exonuclease/phosphatase family metal-dependent hydrolase
VVITGDFNQPVDVVPTPSPLTVAAIQAFTTRYGYTDAAKDKGPTIDAERIDYVLTRGVTATDVVRFASHESDHWGLAATIPLP